MRISQTTAAVFIGSLVIGQVALSAIPQTVSFQGKLADSAGGPAAGPVNITFALYDAPDSVALLWTEPHTGIVLSPNGSFSVMLGVTTTFESQNVDFAQPYWLGVTVGGDAEMQPRIALGTVPYAFRADSARIAESTLSFGSVTEGDIAAMQADVAALAGKVDAADLVDQDPATSPVDWQDLANVPADIADGDADSALDYQQGPGIVIASDTISAEFGSGADQVAPGNHAHALGELTDVEVPSPAPADVVLLAYDNGSSQWLGRDLAGAGVAEAGHLHDARYYTTSAVDAALAAKADAAALAAKADAAELADSDPATTPVSWDDLTGIPADIDDGDADTTYTQGTGILISGGSISADIGAGAAQVAAGAHLHDGTYVEVAGDDMSGPLSVAGIVESTSGGFRFPDGTVQTTTAAALDLPPVALLSASMVDEFPVTVTLNASESYDPENAGLEYAWDFVGMGQYSAPDVPASATRVLDPGLHLLGVKVFDATGQPAESKVMVRVPEPFRLTLDEGSKRGRYPSVAVIGPLPYIAYSDDGDFNLMIVRAASPNGSYWEPPVVVEATGNVGTHASLANVQSQAAIAYFDSSNRRLMYVRSTNAMTCAFGAPVVVDGGLYEPGMYASLAIVNSRPMVAYLDFTNKDLMMCRTSDYTGASWLTPVRLLSTGDVGFFNTLLVVDGNPAIAFADRTDHGVKYLRATDAAGTSWPAEPIMACPATDYVNDVSMAIVDGHPAVAFLQDGVITYVRATDAAGAVWGTPVIVQPALALSSVSLSVIAGRPAIAFGSSYPYALRYARATDAVGSAWSDSVVVDASSYTGLDPALAEIAGKAAIAYHDLGNGDLKFAILP